MSEHVKPNWPATWLAAELRALNRDGLRNHENAMLRGRDHWVNQSEGAFVEERARAQGLGIVPLAPENPAFMDLIRTGQRFNWAILLDGTVRISPTLVMSDEGPVRISHAVLCYNGLDVLAAGEARAGGFLANITGHYKCGDWVVAPVKKAFESMGIHFQP